MDLSSGAMFIKLPVRRELRNPENTISNDLHLNELESTRLFFDQLAVTWDARQPENRVRVLESILDRFTDHFKNSQFILDVGAGTGTLLTILRRFAPNSQLFAVDLSFNMLVQAARKIPIAHLCQADFFDSPFEQRSLSTVICHNCLPHLLPIEKALAELHRILKPGGSLIIVHDLGREQVNAKHKSSSSEFVRSHLIPPTVDLVYLLENAGFQVQVSEDLDSHFLLTARQF